jgi:hypothetical protein
MKKPIRLAVDTADQMHQDLLNRVNERMDLWMRDGIQLYKMGELSPIEWEHDLCKLLLAQLAVIVARNDVPLPVLMRELASFTRQVREQVEGEDD